MGRIIQLTSSFARPADATAYAAGDEVSNHATAASVVRPVFNLTGFNSVKLLRASLDITPASGNLVITALNLAVLLFKTADAPAAVGDNVTHPISAAVRRLAVAKLVFDDGAWDNPLGALTAAASGIQVVTPTLTLPLATPAEIASPAQFSFIGNPLDTRELTAVTQALAAWTPLGVVNTFALRLTFEVD